MEKSAVRPKVRFIISDVEMAMTNQIAQFGGVLMKLVAQRLASLSSPPAVPDMPEVFGRALAFITNTDPEKLEEAFALADVQIVKVPHGTPIAEQRLVDGDEVAVVLLDPRGRPIGQS